MDKLPQSDEEFKKFKLNYFELSENDQIEVELLLNPFYINSHIYSSAYKYINYTPIHIAQNIIKYTTKSIYFESKHNLRLNEDFTIESLLISDSTFKYIPIVLKLDKEFILKCIRKFNADTIRFIKKLQHFLVDTYLYDDYDINIAILNCKSSQFGIPFEFIHQKYKSNSEFIDIALKNCIHNYEVIDVNELTEERIEKLCY